MYKIFPTDKNKTDTNLKQKGFGFMQQFTYILKHDTGIHARPAGLVVNTAKKYDCKITIAVGEKTADAKGLFSVMGLSAKGGDCVCVTCDGADAQAACAALKALFEEHL